MSRNFNIFYYIHMDNEDSALRIQGMSVLELKEQTDGAYLNILEHQEKVSGASKENFFYISHFILEYRKRMRNNIAWKVSANIDSMQDQYGSDIYPDLRDNLSPNDQRILGKKGLPEE